MDSDDSLSSGVSDDFVRENFPQFANEREVNRFYLFVLFPKSH